MAAGQSSRRLGRAIGLALLFGGALVIGFWQRSKAERDRRAPSDPRETEALARVAPARIRLSVLGDAAASCERDVSQAVQAALDKASAQAVLDHKPADVASLHGAVLVQYANGPVTQDSPTQTLAWLASSAPALAPLPPGTTWCPRRPEIWAAKKVLDELESSKGTPGIDWAARLELLDHAMARLPRPDQMVAAPPPLIAYAHEACGSLTGSLGPGEPCTLTLSWLRVPSGEVVAAASGKSQPHGAAGFADRDKATEALGKKLASWK